MAAVGRVLDEFAGRLGVRRRREASDPGERVQVLQPEIERLSAAHRQPGQRPALAVGLHRVEFLDEGDQVLDEVVLEGGECRALLGDWVPRETSLPGSAVGQHDDHRNHFLVGVKVVENHIGRTAARPLLLVAADAVQEIQDRVGLVLRVPRRRVDLGHSFHAHRFRVVRDGFELPRSIASRFLSNPFGGAAILPGLSSFPAGGLSCPTTGTSRPTSTTQANMRPLIGCTLREDVVASGGHPARKRLPLPRDRHREV